MFLKIQSLLRVLCPENSMSLVPHLQALDFLPRLFSFAVCSCQTPVHASSLPPRSRLPTHHTPQQHQPLTKHPPHPALSSPPPTAPPKAAQV